MFFRNLTLFRFPTTLDFSQLDELLPEAALKPVGPLELSSRGFISPFGRGEEALSQRINDAIWLSVGGEDKIYGRTGLLAHTYMLGPNGDSNGCVSFKNYAAFLHAYKSGRIKRLVVVAKL